MNLIEFANQLVREGVGTLGTTLFVMNMPAEAPIGILLRDTGQGVAIDYELRDYRKTKFQVVVRHYDFAAGEALMQQVVAALTTEVDVEWGALAVKRCWPRHEPLSFPVSDGNNFEFSCNFDVVYVILR